MDKPRNQINSATHCTVQHQTQCFQINLQHSRSATSNLMKTIETEEPDVIFVQEPYEYRNKPAGIGKQNRIFTAGNGKHRAAIIIPNDKIDAILITNISNEDTVVLEIIHGNLKFFAASMYFDFEDQIENNLTKIDAILRLAKGRKLLIAADTNSRSKTWHDVTTNSRGKKLEEYLVNKQLYILNEGNESFTFHNRRGSSNIDLTIANNNLIAAVNEWEVSTDESSSDHRYLKYKIGREIKNRCNKEDNRQQIRYIIKEDKYHDYDRKLVEEIMKIANNTEFRGGEEELDKTISTIVPTENDLEKLVDTFAEAIQSACRRTFKTTSNINRTKKQKSVPWWTDRLTIMRKRVNACRRLYQRTRNDNKLRESRKHRYFEEKRQYQVEMRKEKINSWKEYCNVTASSNPWSQVYKLAAGKARNNSILTTLKKPDGSETSSIQETIKVMLDHIITEDREEETSYHKNIRKMIEEPTTTCDDEEFTQEEIKQMIESFSDKKAPEIDGVTRGIYLRTFNKFPRIVTTIYNECLRRGCFPRRWKVAILIPVTKPGKKNCKDPSKYRPISLLNIEGKVLEKLLINRINYYMYKNEILTDNLDLRLRRAQQMPQWRQKIL